MAERAQAARQRGVGGDEGLGLGFIEQDAQPGPGAWNLRAGEHAQQPGEVAGRVAGLHRAGACGMLNRVARCGARWAGGPRAARDEPAQAALQAQEPARDEPVQRHRHFDARRSIAEALLEAQDDAGEAVEDGARHDVRYNNNGR